jgi:hypothetical protein
MCKSRLTFNAGPAIIITFETLSIPQTGQNVKHPNRTNAITEI